MEVPVASSSRSQSPAQRANYQFPISSSNLPVDISLQEALRFQDHVRQVGRSWYDPDSAINIEFCYLSRSKFEEGAFEPEELLCDSEMAVEQALKIIDPATDLILVVIHSRPGSKNDKSEIAGYFKPCITLPIMLSLCRRFGLLPTYAQMMEQTPGFRLYLLGDVQGKGKLPEGQWAQDFCYAAPMPWLAPDLPMSSTYLQQSLFTFSSYGRIAAGVPTLTFFSNIPASLNPAIKSKWLRSLRNISQGNSFQLHDHLTLFSLSIHELQGSLKLYEMFHGIYGETRVELHVENAQGNLETTVKRSREFTSQMVWFRSSIDNTEEILKGLGRVVPMVEQTRAWTDNLFSQLGFIHRRIEDIISRQRAAESTVISYIALRDSQALAHNTQEMTLMARATEKSGNEMSAMTRGMERDARLMKFLAEVTAFFLPVTAIATIFSMPFFSVTAPARGVVPIFSNALYSWVYFSIVGITSILVFSWWGYKHYEIRSQFTPSSSKKGEDMEDIDTDEASSSSQKSLDTSQNKLVAALIRRNAIEKLDELNKKQPGDDDEDDVRMAWNGKHDKLFTILLLAQRAMETGEDVQKFLASAENRESREN